MSGGQNDELAVDSQGPPCAPLAPDVAEAVRQFYGYGVPGVDFAEMLGEFLAHQGGGWALTRRDAATPKPGLVTRMAAAHDDAGHLTNREAISAALDVVIEALNRQDTPATLACAEWLDSQR